MKHIFLTFCSISILLFSCNKNDKPKPDHSGLFIKFFGGAKNDAGYSVKESGDGGFVIVGSTVAPGKTDKDCYVVKTDADGNKIWDRTFGDQYDQEGFDVKVDRQGNYIVAGYWKNIKDSTDFMVLKYNRDGALVDTFFYGLPDRNEIAKFVTITSDGGILIAGTRQQAVGMQVNMFVVKTNNDTVTWQKDLGLNALYDQMGTIVELPNTNLLWCGTVNRGLETDLRITMSDAYSNLKWDLSIGEGDGKNQEGKEIHTTDDGNFIVGGSEISPEGNKVLLAKINEFGTVLWQTYPGGAGRTANSVYPCSNGGYILAGQVEENYMLMQTDGSGNMSWEKNYGGTGLDQASRVVETADKGFLVVGTIYAANNTLMGLFKTDDKGEINKK